MSRFVSLEYYMDEKSEHEVHHNRLILKESECIQNFFDAVRKTAAIPLVSLNLTQK